MTKEEKLSKINLLKSFCAQNGISFDEFCELSSWMKIIKSGSPFDIYYEDGEVTRRIDLTKNPIAFKISLLPTEGNVWVSASVLKEANLRQAQAYLKSLPKISSHSWRFPLEREMTSLLEKNLEKLTRLKHVFSLPDFMEPSADNEYVFFGCFDDYQRIYAVYFIYPGAFLTDITADFGMHWWPMCDAD